MRKVIKNVLKVVVASFSTLLLLLVIVPLVASLLINLPGIQNMLVRKAMTVISDKLGTTVSIDHIRVKLINKVEIDGFYVEDLRGDTLLYVNKIVAPIVELGLMGEPLTFGKVLLGDTQMWLRRDSLRDMNIRELVQAIKGDDQTESESNFRLQILGVDAPNITFGILSNDKPFHEGVDFSRFVIRNTKIDVNHLSVIGGEVRIGINSVCFDERSGFRMDALSAHDLVISEGKVLLDNVRIKAEGADLDLPYVHLEGSNWESYSSFIDSVSMNIGMNGSTFMASTVGWFLPAVKDWGVTLDNVTLNTLGAVSAITGDIENADIMGSSLSMDFKSRGLPDFEKTWVDANIRNLTTTAADVDSILRNVVGKGLSEGIARTASRFGEAGLTGHIKGQLTDFKANGVLVSDAGEVSAGVTMGQHKGETRFNSELNIQRLEVGQLADIDALGMVSADITMRGQLESDGHIEGDVDARLHSLAFNGYDYRNLSLEGKLDDKMFDGAIHSHDRSLRFDFLGMLDFNDSIPRYNFDLDLKKADLVATKIFARDSVARLSARINALGSGRGFDDLNGTVRVHDLSYIAPADTIRTELVTLNGRNSIESKLITLASDFVDAEFRSRIGYRDMFAYLRDFLRDYVPLLYDDKDEEPALYPVRNVADATNYSILNVRIKNTDKLLDVFVPGAQLAPNTEVAFSFNPFVRSFSLKAESDYVEYKNMLATHLELNSNNASDSLTFYLTSQDFYQGRLYMPNMAVHGGARGRQMTLTTRLSNPKDNFTALLGMRIDSGNGNDRKIRLRLTPSYLTLEEQTWYFGVRSIIYDAPKVIVDNFRVYSDRREVEELSLNGVISNQQSDTLHILLNQFDMAPLSQLTEGAGYKAAGRATGYIDFISMLKSPRMLAGIDFSELSLNGSEAATLRFTSFWDRNKVRFQMLNQNNNVNVLRGSFSPSNGIFDAVATLDGLDLSLLDPILEGAIENSSGTANVRLDIGGTFRNLKLDGKIEIPRFQTTVQFTQATYTLENGLIEVRDSRLKLPSTIVSDRFGNTAGFSLGVDLSNMRNIGFDISATPRNLLAFNTKGENNEAFYGQVFATGALSIKGDKLGTKMNISATTERDSKFYLPLNAKSNISWADFVVFADSGQSVDTMNVLARKKQMYERRLRSDAKNKTGKPLDLDMTIDLTPDAEFQMVIDPNLGNGISAYGEGVINIKVNPSNNLFSMVGDCTISSGRFEFSMMDVFNKDFAITPGSTLVWTGEPEDAILDVKGIYRIRTSLLPLLGENGPVTNRSVPVDCILRLSGRLSQPEITFDVKVPSLDIETQSLLENSMNTQELKSTQFLSLLMMGSFVPGGSLGQAGTMSSGAVGFDLLTSQLSNLLSTEDYNIYLRYKPQNEYTGTGSEFDVGFSKGFIDDRLILEIEGNYVDDRAANSTGTGSVSNLAGDVSLTWVIDRAGNLRLKVFTQTIDRWNETQGLQESGLGIYYKKDFNTGRDLWHGIRDTFTTFDKSDRRRNKKQERQARRETRREQGQ